ncbi:MAG: NUDIX domain-containing protein [Pirellulales bacterium]
MDRPVTSTSVEPAGTCTDVAIAVVRRYDRVLIGRRGDDGPLPGYWEFPGGKVMPGESTSTAAIRECREESGLDVAVVGTLDVTVHDYPHGRLRISFHECRPATANEADLAKVQRPFAGCPSTSLTVTSSHRPTPSCSSVC